MGIRGDTVPHFSPGTGRIPAIFRTKIRVKKARSFICLLTVCNIVCNFILQLQLRKLQILQLAVISMYSYYKKFIVFFVDIAVLKCAKLHSTEF